MQLIMKSVFGSHLYGTSVPESDQDFKAIYLPPIENCILQKVPKSIIINTKNKHSEERNTSVDVDFETYSLQYFLQLGFAGETVILDMLHTPPDKLIETSPEWQFIQANRKRFYTKNARAYISYVRRQAAKYGVKGSRLQDAENVINFLKKLEPHLRLADVWEQLPMGEHIKKYEISKISGDNKWVYDICGRKLMATSPVPYALDPIEKFYTSYGARAKQAQANEGIDWKAISHAYRASYQLKEIYETGDLKYPLKNADFLRDLKLGKHHYIDDRIGEQLDELVDQMEKFCAVSKYPEKVDTKFWDDWLVSLYK